MASIRSYLILALSAISFGTFAFCGYIVTALNHYFFLVDAVLFGSFIFELGLYFFLGQAASRVFIVSVVAFVSQLSVLVVRGDKNSRRAERILFANLYSYSPVPFQVVAIITGFFAFIFFYLGNSYIEFFFGVLIILWSTSASLFRFRHSLIRFLRRPNSRLALSLLSRPKIAFVISTAWITLAFLLGYLKAGELPDQNHAVLCNGGNNLVGHVVGRSREGLVFVETGEDGKVVTVTLAGSPTNLRLGGDISDCT